VTVHVNIRDLDRFDAGAEVTPESLVENGLLKNTKIDVKLLGTGEISNKLTIRLHAVSASAREKIEKAGGTIELLREPKVRKVKTHTAKPEAVAEPDEAEAPTDEAAKEETPTDEAATAPEE
jgi:large subunit ribosomal protein L15